MENHDAQALTSFTAKQSGRDTAIAWNTQCPILVVDDDEGVRSFARRALTRAGLAVQIAADATQALRMMELLSPPVILTDVRMPGMNGLELIRHVKERWPATRVVVMTGFPDRETAMSARAHGVTRILFKPLDAVRMQEVLKQELAGQSHRTSGGHDERTILTRGRLFLVVDPADPGFAVRAADTLRRFSNLETIDRPDDLSGQMDATDGVILTHRCWEKEFCRSPAIIHRDDCARIIVIDPSSSGTIHRSRTNDEIVQYAPEPKLVHAVYEAISQAARHRLMREIAIEHSAAPMAVAILEMVCSRLRPPLTTSEGADLLGISRSYASRQWLNNRTPDCPHLKEALDAILHWRVVLNKTHDTSWRSSIEKLGLSSERFSAISARVADRTPAQLLESDDWRALSIFGAIRKFGAGRAG